MKLKEYEPPELAVRMLCWFCNPIYLEDILGDLEEEYEIANNEREIKFVKLWFFIQVILLLRLSLIRPLQPIIFIENQINMFRNHLKIGVRNLWKYKSGTVINLVGLSTGIAAFLLIALFVVDELSYDKHHEHAQDIYRITVKNFNKDGDLSRHWAFASAGHAPRIKEDFPQVTHAVRFFPWAFPDVLINDKRFPGEQVVFCDPDVFDVFTFPFLIGDPANALNNPTSIVLTRTSAIRLFGNDWEEKGLIGQSIVLEAQGNRIPVSITGVMEDMPDQQHFRFEYFSPWALYEMAVDEATVNNVGGNYNYLSYVKAVPGTDPQEMNGQSDTFFDKYIEPFSSGKASEFYKLNFQPLLDIHLKSNLAGEFKNNGDIKQVYALSIVAALLLIIACINYMNLATSRYSRRMKEIGVRKAIGATRGSLISQFMTESLLLTLGSIPIALLLVQVSLPYLNELVDKSMVFNFWENAQMIFLLITLIAVVGIVAGLYPSLYLSGMKILNSLKGESRMRYQKINFRSILVTFQYVVAIGLIFSILVLNKQLKYIFNSDPGYDKEQILTIGLTSSSRSNLQVLKNDLLASSNIVSVTAASRIPTGRLNDAAGARIVRNDSALNLNFRLPYINVDEDFLETFGIELVAGENFESYMESDSVGYYLINEAAAKAIGFLNPEEAIGQKMRYGNAEGRIYGVTRDFHFESVHNEIAPMILRKVNRYRRLCVKLKAEDIPNTVALIEQEWSKIDPVNPISYKFIDELFERQYIREQSLDKVFKIFTGIAVLISCLGMLGMVSFIIERKLKEIGIRKVLGASMVNIVWLIGKYFTYLIIIGSIISIPIGFWLMTGWLQGFAYQIQIGLMLVLAPIAIIVILSTVTVLYSTVKASLVNPVECLKDE